MPFSKVAKDSHRDPEISSPKRKRRRITTDTEEKVKQPTNSKDAPRTVPRLQNGGIIKWHETLYSERKGVKGLGDWGQLHSQRGGSSKGAAKEQSQARTQDLMPIFNGLAKEECVGAVSFPVFMPGWPDRVPQTFW